MGDDDLALEYFARAEKVNEQLGTRSVPAILDDVGRAYELQGKYDLAMDSYRRALARHEAAGGQSEIAQTLENRGTLRRIRGDLRATVFWKADSPPHG